MSSSFKIKMSTSYGELGFALILCKMSSYFNIKMPTSYGELGFAMV